MSKHIQQPQSVFDAALLKGALLDSLKKLDPRTLWRNPVMFCVEIASVITLVTFVMSLTGANKEPAWFTGAVIGLALADRYLLNLCRGAGRGTRQGPRRFSLRKSRTDVTAKVVYQSGVQKRIHHRRRQPAPQGRSDPG